MVRASVIIACYNEEKRLGETLEGLVAQEFDGDWEVVFADNGSTDRSAEIFKDYAHRHPGIAMRYLDASASQGKSHALNLAIPAARSETLIFCDADDVPAQGWLSAMVSALTQHDFVACRADLDRLNKGWVRHYRPYNASITGLGRTNYPPHANYGGGNTLGFSKKVFEAVGPFDPRAQPLEDIDYCIRAQLMGYSIEFVADAVMHVRFRDDLDALYRQKYGYAVTAVYLAKRYAGHDPKSRLQRVKRNVRRMQRNLGLWVGIVPGYLSFMSGRIRDPLEAAAFRWEQANAVGKLAGMLKHRSLPP